MDKIVLTTGTFNIVHAGHIELFEFCIQFGKLYVAVNGNDYLTKKYKTKAIPLEYRLKVLSSLKQIDSLVVFEEDTPCSIINQVRPDVYVKGPDYRGKNIPEAKVLTELGVEFLIQSEEKIMSTSDIIYQEKRYSL